MPRRFQPVCSNVLPTVLLLLLAPGAAQYVQAQAQPHVAIPLNHVSLLNLQCKASQSAVFVGATVTIQASGTSLQGFPLQYSFGVSAGRLEPRGNSALLHTNGLAPQVVNVTCTVADTQGRRVSQNIAITITAAKIESGTLHLPTAAPTSTRPPPPPPPPPPAEIPSTTKRVPPLAPGVTVTDDAQVPKHPEAPLPAAKPPASSPTPVKAAPAPAPVPVQPPAPQSDQAHGTGHGTQSPPVQPVQQGTTGSGSPNVHDVHGDTAIVFGQNDGKAKPPDEYQQSESVEQWVSHLRQGKIEYQVPTSMTVQVASTVTVVIHGYQDVGTTTLPAATGSGSLKQSERMRVELLAPENPGAFTIAAQDGDTIRFVPINGTTTWMWTVTPNSAGNNLKLEVRASVIYPGTDDKTEQQVETYDAKVAVAVQPFWSTAIHYIRDHPLQVLGYLIPGGAGFTFLAGLVVWLWKRRQKGETPDAATVPSTKPPQRKRRS